MPTFKEAVELVGKIVEAAWVLAIALGMLRATIQYLVPQFRAAGDSFTGYRQTLGRAILLGLEFLVAGDIIRTVAVDPTLENVLVLGIIVLIRTFLSMSLQVELEGRWPWQQAARSS